MSGSSGVESSGVDDECESIEISERESGVWKWNRVRGDGMMESNGESSGVESS